MFRNKKTLMERSKEEIIENIKYIIDQYVQPAVEQHGGYIKLEDFDQESGRVLVLLQGSCSGCASSTITLKMGVENMLKHYVKEVNGVDGMDDPNFNDPYYT
jgi:Fe-S cluster biogenesis protein NfuA